MATRKYTGELGVPLSRKAARVLKDAGIYAHPFVTVEHQHLAKRYVVRGMESGGAVREFGRYVTFLGENGERIPHLHPVEAIGVNGLHAVVIAPAFVRLDMLRKGRTYQVLITGHKPGGSQNGSLPRLESSILFRGVHGRIEFELWGKDKARAGSVLPTFYSLAGEPTPIPKKFVEVLRLAAKAVNCLNCTHSHFLLRARTAAPAAALAPVPATITPAPGLTDEMAVNGTMMAEESAELHKLAS
jgi:hypothetical protein